MTDRQDSKALAAVNAMKGLFGADQRRVMHALRVLDYAKRIQAEEGGDLFIVKAAAALHDIGMHEAERKHGSSAGVWQELEGPPIARRILESLRAEEDETEHVCRIVGSHHSAKGIDSMEFRIIWDADWLANIPEELDMSDKAALGRFIERVFKTVAGRRIAEEEYLGRKICAATKEGG